MSSYTRTFTVAKNTVSSKRSGTITFTLGEVSEAVTVNQAAGEGTSMSSTAAEVAALMYPGLEPRQHP